MFQDTHDNALTVTSPPSSPVIFSQYAQDPLEGFSEMFPPWDLSSQSQKRLKPSAEPSTRPIYDRITPSPSLFHQHTHAARRRIFAEEHEDCPPIPLTCRKTSKRVSKKRSFKRSHGPPPSFVVQSASTSGRRLIKIQIIDISDTRVPSESEEENTLLSAQYVVQDHSDQIMDQTESVISNISKKNCGYSYFM